MIYVGTAAPGRPGGAKLLCAVWYTNARRNSASCARRTEGDAVPTRARQGDTDYWAPDTKASDTQQNSRPIHDERDCRARIGYSRRGSLTTSARDRTIPAARLDRGGSDVC